MSILLFIILPIGWALTGKLVGTAVAAAFLYSVRGKDLGRTIGRWCVPLLPTLYLALIIVGADGSAGRGFSLFGSAEIFEMACAFPIYAVPVLAALSGAIYVARDLTIGHKPR